MTNAAQAYTYRKDLYYIQSRQFMGYGLTGQYPQWGVREIVVPKLMWWVWRILFFWKYKKYTGFHVLQERSIK